MYLTTRTTIIVDELQAIICKISRFRSGAGEIDIAFKVIIIDKSHR